MPAFPGSQWIEPILSVVIFFYGGVPFLQMAVPELRNRLPGMMTLISPAILVAFVYSLAVLSRIVLVKEADMAEDRIRVNGLAAATPRDE